MHLSDSFWWHWSTQRPRIKNRNSLKHPSPQVVAKQSLLEILRFELKGITMFASKTFRTSSCLSFGESFQTFSTHFPTAERGKPMALEDAAEFFRSNLSKTQVRKKITDSANLPTLRSGHPSRMCLCTNKSATTPQLFSTLCVQNPPKKKGYNQ